MPAYDVQAFDNGYNDGLEITGFGLALPADAMVRGLAFTVDRDADDDQAVDQSVRILRAGSATGTDHASATHWPQTFSPVVYGGPNDTWGTTWSAQDVNQPGFGVVIVPRYLSSAGNDRVEVDSVSVTVFYGGTSACP